MAINNDLNNLKNLEEGLVNNKVINFSYTQNAYNCNDVNGVYNYDVCCENNIPVADASIVKINNTVVTKGYRSKASSITRMLVNHIFGRVSYNLNKVHDNFLTFISSMLSSLGTANGIATLDENGRLPYSQLPESAVEIKGTWNASTNIWTGNNGSTGSLISGTGNIGDTYIVTTEGWFDSATGQSSATPVAGYEHYLVNGRIMYNGTDWVNISGGSQYALCNESYFRAGANSCVGSCAVSIGSSSNSGSQSVSIGANAGSYASSYTQTVAIGYTARALGNYGVSIGTQSGASHYGDYNVAIGVYALYGASNSKSNYNIAIGANTLRCLASGSQNTAIGMDAGCAVTTGSNVTAIGYNALSHSTTGSDHTAIGASALASLTTGLYNTAIGARALCGLTTGCENFGLGINTGWAITTGCNNVLIGNNTAQGIAGNSSDNVVIGKNAMCASCSCEVSNTVIIGSKAGVNNKSNGVVFIGYNSGFSNTTGSDNTFLGMNSGLYNTTGNSNTFIGACSGLCNTTGNCNTFIGKGSGYHNTTGFNNIFIGATSGFFNTTGSNNIVIGDSVYNAKHNDLQCNILIGNQVIGDSCLSGANTIIGNYGINQSNISHSLILNNSKYTCGIADICNSFYVGIFDEHFDSSCCSKNTPIPTINGITIAGTQLCTYTKATCASFATYNKKGVFISTSSSPRGFSFNGGVRIEGRDFNSMSLGMGVDGGISISGELYSACDISDVVNCGCIFKGWVDFVAGENDIIISRYDSDLDLKWSWQLSCDGHIYFNNEQKI